MFIRPTARDAARSRARQSVERAARGHRFAAAATSRARGGFTLLEVIAAMALIVFLIGGVYAVGGGAVALGASMNRARIIETRISSFVGAWREYLETLPPGIRFTGKGRGLLIENGNVPFAWHRAVRRADAVEFAVAPNGSGEGGDFLVRHLKRPERPTKPDEYKLVAELPLLEGLRSWDWKFYEPIEKKWFADWDPKKRAQPPLFMRLQFSFVGDPRQFEYTFWVANDFVTPQNMQTPAPAAPNAPGQPAARP